MNRSQSTPLVRRCTGTTAGLGYFGSRLGLPCKNPPFGSESVPALSSCRMWTVCMINCLRYASYHTDTGPLEPLMWGVQVRAQCGERLIPLLTLTLKQYFQHTTMLTPAPPRHAVSVKQPSRIPYNYHVHVLSCPVLPVKSSRTKK